MKSLRMPLILLAVLLIAGGAVWFARQKAAIPPQQAKPAEIKAGPTQVSSGVPEAAEIHARLLAEAQQMPEPSLAPAVSKVPGQARAQAVEALNDQKPEVMPDAVPLDHQVAIGFTANVIGETDPCG